MVSNNPYVVGEPYIRHYMGAPITVAGFRIGALCIMDVKAHEKRSKNEREILCNLADVVAREIYLQHLLREAIPAVLSVATTSSTDIYATTTHNADAVEKNFEKNSKSQD